MMLAAGGGALAGAMQRRRFTQRMLEELKDTARETVKTRKELGVGWLEGPILESLVDQKLKGKDGETVTVRKTSENRYYLEKP